MPRKYETPEILHDAPLHDGKRADFHFDDFAATFARLIASPQTETPLAIGINGAWGSGKTSLLMRVKNMLDEPKGEDGKGKHRFAEGKEEFRKCKTIWFNAWKYNDEDELLGALVRVILQAMQRDGLANHLKAWLNDPTQKSYDVVAMFINAFEASFGGLKFKLDLQKHAEPSPFEKYAAFLDYFNDAFELLLKSWTGDGILAIFIDDLDRCLPEKTVQVLETIKLFLDKQGCVFVLGADISIVQKAVENHYNNAGITGESAKDYLEKIIQLRFNLPPILEKAMEDYLRAQDKTKVDEAMLKRWQALVAAAEVNPRRVKNVINDLNLQWFMAKNSRQVEGVNRDDFICWQALMRAAPESFVKQIGDLSELPDIRHDFVLKAVKWQQGNDDEKKELEGQYAAYKDFKRLRGVLKQISFSNGFTPEALEALIYMAAPPPKPEPEKITVDEAKKIVEPELVGSEVFAEVSSRGKIAPPSERNRLVIGGLEFLRIPTGKSVMGSKDDNELAGDSEKPQHTVELSDYWMAKFILTNQIFSEFATATSYRTTAEEKGSGYTNDGTGWKDMKGADWKHPLGLASDLKEKDDHPVVLVSWEDAMAYCKWFNEFYKTELGNLTLRLPSEAEWEKAARGAYGNEWPWGNEFDKSKCNSSEGGKKGTTPVGLYSAAGGDSPYGCADMVGNVWEWCADWFDDAEYKKRASGSVVNPLGPQKSSSRVLRGGSFDSPQGNARCAYRGFFDPTDRFGSFGFRVCASSPS